MRASPGLDQALGRALYDPGDLVGKMFFNILATFAEFEADLIRMRTREGLAIARAKGKLRGKQPKLSDRQQRELCRMHATGEYSISDLAELFSVSRPTVYRTLNRRHPLPLSLRRPSVDSGLTARNRWATTQAGSMTGTVEKVSSRDCRANSLGHRSRKSRNVLVANKRPIKWTTFVARISAVYPPLDFSTIPTSEIDTVPSEVTAD